MHTFRHHVALFALLFTAGSAVGEPVDAEWISYRDAYRSMVLFEKYGKAKHLIQQQLQVVPRDKSVAPDGLQLTLQGKRTRLNLPLDATGRAVFPLLKEAYDDNASLVLNGKGGQFLFRPRVSLVVRPDGVYEAAELRAACEQALAYQRQVEPGMRASRCTGVRFVFARTVIEPGVRLRKGEGPALPPVDGAAFAGDAYEGFRVVNYTFGEAREQVVTQNVPLAISPLYQ